MNPHTAGASQPRSARRTRLLRILGRLYAVGDEADTLVIALSALGMSIASDAECLREIREHYARRVERGLEPVYVHTARADGPAPGIRVYLRKSNREGDRSNSAELIVEWEDGAEPLRLPIAIPRRPDGARAHNFWQTELKLPAHAPSGYHRLVLHRPGDPPAHSLWIVCPPRAYSAPGRLTGLAVQTYALRSRRGGRYRGRHMRGGPDQADGPGDFAELFALIEFARKRNYSFVGISPVHALPLAPRGTAPSPYFPSSRARVDPLLADLERVPEFAWLSESAGAPAAIKPPGIPASDSDTPYGVPLDHARAAGEKLALFERCFAVFLEREVAHASRRARDFAEYRQREAAGLERQATYDALYEFFARSGDRHREGHGWSHWPAAFQDPESAAVQTFARNNHERVAFFAYLYWIAETQFQDLAREYAARGLRLFADLAVGADPDGGEVWSAPGAYLREAAIGAPPDDFSPNGQNWGLAPFHPAGLRAAAYGPYIELLRRNMPEDGLLRVDHAAQWMRLYWIPRDSDPNSSRAAPGFWMSYPAEELLGILCLESVRRRCVIVGEDLGTMPPTLRATMDERGIYGFRVLYFERDSEGEFQPADSYPPLSLACLNTHDLPTLSGFWSGLDIQLRQNLGILPTALSAREARTERAVAREALLRMLRNAGLLQPEQTIGDDDLQRLRDLLFAFLDRCGSRLIQHSLHDLLLERAQPNLPGTVGEYPNWSLRYSRTIDELNDDLD